LNRVTPTQAILGAEADRYRAMIAGDVDALRSACDPKMRYVSFLGVTETLDSWIAKIEADTFRYDRIEHPVDSIQIYDTVAIVHGRMHAHGDLHGEPISASTITISVLTCDEDGHWRLLAFQATAVAA